MRDGNQVAPEFSTSDCRGWQDNQAIKLHLKNSRYAGVSLCLSEAACLLWQLTAVFHYQPFPWYCKHSCTFACDPRGGVPHCHCLSVNICLALSGLPSKQRIHRHTDATAAHCYRSVAHGAWTQVWHDCHAKSMGRNWHSMSHTHMLLYLSYIVRVGMTLQWDNNFIDVTLKIK